MRLADVVPPQTDGFEPKVIVGPEGCVFTTALLEADEVHPPEFVTVNV